MSPYLLTLSFLALMSILSSSELMRFTQQLFGMRLNAAGLEMRQEMEELKARSCIADFRESENAKEEERPPVERKPRGTPSTRKRSTPLGFNQARPPNNARLNLYFALVEQPATTPTTFSYYETAARLLRMLYQEDPLFRAIPAAEYQILEALKQKKEELEHIETPDALATLLFSDPTVTTLFHHLLTGDAHFPSLLPLITFDKISPTSHAENTKINLLFAPQEVLLALCNDPFLVEHLIKIRESVWQEIVQPKEEPQTRTLLKKKLKDHVHTLLISYAPNSHYHQLFDYSLGKMGTILFVTDPKTGITTRKHHRKETHA